MANCFWFYSILAGWSTWQWVFLNFSQNFWSFDTPDTPGCASAVFAENAIWNRLKQFLPLCVGLIWSGISQGFHGYSNFACRTNIGGLIDKKTDFFTLLVKEGATRHGSCWFGRHLLSKINNFRTIWLKYEKNNTWNIRLLVWRFICPVVQVNPA